jgi:dTDP-4-amino-4,6-dideoxy-D-galactose acyltransferase
MLGIARFNGCATARTSSAPALALRLSEMQWETSLLGRKIGRVEGVDTITDVSSGTEAIHRVERRAISSGFSVITARVAANHVPAVWALETSGFVTVDIGVIFEYDAQKSTRPMPDHAPGEPIIRLATDDDVPMLQQIVNGLFCHSYYYVSPCFSSAEADRLFRAWITNCVQHGRADRVWLAETSGGIAGFVTCRCLLPDDVGVIDLIGVAPNHGSRGLGKALVRTALASFHELGVAIVRVRTQIANHAAVNLYAATGARLVTTDTTLIKSLAGRRTSAD